MSVVAFAALTVALAGVIASAGANPLRRHREAVRWMLARGRSRWSPECATRDEESLARRLSMPKAPPRLNMPAEHEAWRQALILGAVERLLEDLRLRRQGRVEELVLVWSQLTLGQRRMIVAGARQHFLKPWTRQVGKQFAKQSAEHQGFGRTDRPFVDSFDHGSSLGSEPGCEPETAAGASPSPSKGGDA